MNPLNILNICSLLRLSSIETTDPATETFYHMAVLAFESACMATVLLRREAFTCAELQVGLPENQSPGTVTERQLHVAGCLIACVR